MYECNCKYYRDGVCVDPDVFNPDGCSTENYIKHLEKECKDLQDKLANPEKVCDHQFICLMTRSVSRGYGVSSTRRVHWCWKCGRVDFSNAGNYSDLIFHVGVEPTDKQKERQ